MSGLAYLKMAVVVMVGAVLLVGRDEFYPLTQWPMYSQAGQTGAPAEISAFDLRVIDRSGRIDIVRELYPPPLEESNEPVIRTAQNSRDPATLTDYRLRLIERLDSLYPDRDPVQVQFYRTDWRVDEYAVPPLDYASPDAVLLIGSFSVRYYRDLLAPPPAPDEAVDFVFGERFALLGFDVPDGVAVHQCEPLYIRSWWRVLNPAETDDHITLVLADSSGVGRAQSDARLGDGSISDLFDHRIIDIPCDLPVGAYNLLVGVYELETVQNLPVQTAAGGDYGGTLVYLTTIDVQPVREGGG
jgi:hypothetical protein